MRGEQLAFDVEGQLFFGDNLEVLRRHVDDESVDLVYLDPPFNSNRSYNLLFQHRDGRKAAAQQKAFDDTWTWTIDSARIYQDVVEHGGDVSRVLRAFREVLGTSDMLAYLTMMAPRLVALHRVLKPTGSLYLHCDPNASHYLKMLLDAVFLPTNFLSEVTWRRTGTHSSAKRWAPVHDTLLMYAKHVGQHTWNRPYEPLGVDHKARHYRHHTAEGRVFTHGELTAPGVRNGRSGMSWRGFDVTGIGRHWSTTIDKLDEMDDAGLIYFPTGGGWPRRIRFEDESQGRAIGDVWADIPPVNMKARERLGFPTQKPTALLERIIKASSNEGDVVLDPFCGCGTAIDAAHRLGRAWIGIDITEVAIEVIQERIRREYGELDYVLRGEPTSIDEAQALANLDKHEFQGWACRQLGIDEPVRKGADRGIDGRLVGMYDSGESWEGIISVKGGAVRVTDVRSR